MKTRSYTHSKSPSRFGTEGHTRHPVLIAMTMAFLATAFSFFPASAADHYITVVDLSGSMNAREKGNDGKERTRLEFVQTSMSSHVRSLPEDSTLHLIAFNKGVVSQASSLSMKHPQDRDAALTWVEQRNAPDNAKTYLWTTTDYALALARDIQTEDPAATIYIRILTDGEDTEGKTNFTEVIQKYPEVDGKTLHVDFLTLGIELSIPPKEGVTVTPVSDWEDIFPPVIIYHPSSPKVGDEIVFFYKAQSRYDRVEWSVDGENLGNESELTLLAPPRDEVTVTLQAYREKGVKSTSKTISLFPPDLDAAFTLVPENGMVGSGFHFVRKSPDHTVSSTFEVLNEKDEIVFSTEEGEPVFTPHHPGTFRVVHRIHDKTGVFSDEAEKRLTVSPRNIKADFVVIPENVISGEKVRFVDRSTGGITERSLDFGDGTVVRNALPVSHLYKIAENTSVTYTIQLTVEDEFGQTSTAEQEITVHPPDLTAAFTLIPAEGRVGDEFHLVSRSTERAANISFEVLDERDVVVFSSDEAETVFIPGLPGSYRAVHRIQDASGVFSGDEQKPFTVSPQTLQADFDLMPETVVSGEEIRIVDRSIGKIVNRTIQMGDGTVLENEVPLTHTYEIFDETPVSYSVRLTVEDEFGQSSTATQEVTVLPPERPEVRFSIGTPETEWLSGATIRFLNESAGIHSWKWYRNGEEIETSDRNPAVTFPEPGRFLIALAGSDKTGKLSDRFEQEIIILERYENPQIKEIHVSDAKGRTPSEVLISSDIEGDYKSLTWTLPGGKTITDQEEITLFLDQPGRHTVKLEVVGMGESGVTETSSIEIEAKAPLSKWITIGIPSLVAILILGGIAITLLNRLRDQELSGTIIVRKKNGSESTHTLEGRVFPLDSHGAPGYAIRYEPDTGAELFRKNRRIKPLRPGKQERAGAVTLRYLRS